MQVRRQFPNISLGTVYRNLMLLRSLGKLRLLEVGDGCVHFDACTEEHSHFICTKCKAIRDICPRTGLVPALPFRGEIHRCEVYYYGLCEDCLQEMQPTAAGL